jgi:hypothetical protein
MRYDLAILALAFATLGVVSIWRPRWIHRFNTFFWNPHAKPSHLELLVFRLSGFFYFVGAAIVLAFAFIDKK